MQIAGEVLDVIGTAHIAAFLLDLGHSSQAAERRKMRVDKRKTKILVGFGLAVEVKAQFFGEFQLRSAPPQY